MRKAFAKVPNLVWVGSLVPIIRMSRQRLLHLGHRRLLPNLIGAIPPLARTAWGVAGLGAGGFQNGRQTQRGRRGESSDAKKLSSWQRAGSGDWSSGRFL